MSIDKRLSFFFVCLGERGTVREESRDKSFPESMCAVLSLFFFPGQRSGEASYFWLLSGWGERQRQQGAAAFYEVPWLPHTRPLIRLGFLGQAKSPPCVCVSECVHVGGTVHESGGCNWCRKGHKWWQTIEQAVKFKC